MTDSMRSQIEQLHATPHKTVLAVSGAGTQAVAWLLGVSGASRTILEVVVPYGRLAMQDFLGFEPTQSAAAETARQMARRAWQRAREQLEDDSPAVGLACAATIATDRPKRGDHRAFVSAWDDISTATWSLTFHKGLRDRAGEEDVVSRLIVSALSEFSGLNPEPELGLTAGDRLEVARVARLEPLEQLLSGEARWVVRCPGGEIEVEGDVPPALLPGSFNPLHIGHREMMDAAARTIGQRGAFELSVANVDKPPLEKAEIVRRLAQFGPGRYGGADPRRDFPKESGAFPPQPVPAGLGHGGAAGGPPLLRRGRCDAAGLGRDDGRRREVPGSRAGRQRFVSDAGRRGRSRRFRSHVFGDTGKRISERHFFH